MRIGRVDRRAQENWIFRAFGIFILGLTLWIMVALTLTSADAGTLSVFADLSSKLKASYGIDLFGNSMGSLQLSIIEDAWKDGGGSSEEGGGLGGLIALFGGSPVPTATQSDHTVRQQGPQEPTRTTSPSSTPSLTSTPAPTATPSLTPTATEVDDSGSGNEEPTATPSPTATKHHNPKATDTPEPTETSEPANTPEPTSTPEPTDVPTEEPTEEPSDPSPPPPEDPITVPEI